MAKPSGFLEWDLPQLAAAMRLQEADATLYFTDGRRVSFMLERRIAYEVLDGTLAPSEGAGWDVRDSAGLKWEVRSISRGGIYFCPSYMVGSGRSFNEPGFLSKLDEIEGYYQFANLSGFRYKLDKLLGIYYQGQLHHTTRSIKE